MVQRDVRDYLQDILQYIAIVERLIDGITFEEFEGDEKIILALTRAVEVVGEAAKQIPLSLREQYSEIAWKQIIGMRDRLAHAYFSIDLDILWNAALQDLQTFKPTIQTMLDRLDKDT
ncbi:MAG: DUF86 domain-containing protein [Cyanobacteria bacterium P01_F01_bin.13]